MRYKVYEYHWMDHYGDNSWVDPDKYKTVVTPEVITGIGILVAKDKYYYYFTSGVQGDGYKYNGVMAVMKKNIGYMKQVGVIDTTKYGEPKNEQRLVQGKVQQERVAHIHRRLSSPS